LTLLWTEHRFISFDETPIFYRRLETSQPPKALVILVHGMGEHGGRYKHVAEYLAELGFECVVPDLRGFGHSGGARTTIRHFSDYLEDLRTLYNFLLRTKKGPPFFILGHSFGGLIASSFSAFSRPDRMRGLVLSSPIFGIGIPVPFWRHALGIISSYLFPGYRQSSGVNPARLTHDVSMLDRYKEDPCIDHRISSRLYRELVGAMDRRAQIAERIRIPVLVLQAGEDSIVSKEKSVQFYHELKTADKELEVYDGFYHEILNEIGRDRVLMRIGLWLQKHL